MGEGSLRARRPGRHVVVLADPGGGVAVLSQRRRSMRRLGRDYRVVARIAGRPFGHRAEADRVMIAPGQERRAGRRAERGVVHLRIAEAARGEFVERRRRYDAAKRGVRAVARVVDENEQDVRRALGRHDRRRPAGLTVDQIRLDEAGKRRRRRRQHFAVGEVDRRRRSRVGRRAEADGGKRRRQGGLGRGQKELPSVHCIPPLRQARLNKSSMELSSRRIERRLCETAL